MTGAPTPPGVPAHEHPIDPLSERLGALGADVTAIRERLTRIEASMATRSEMRTLIGGLYALLVIGLTVLGWLVTRPSLG